MARRRRAAGPIPARPRRRRRRRTDERHLPTVGRDGRRAVPDAPAGQLASATAADRAQPQMGLVLVPADAAQDVDDRRPVGGEAESLEGDLGTDEGSGRWHRS